MTNYRDKGSQQMDLLKISKKLELTERAADIIEKAYWEARNKKTGDQRTEVVEILIRHFKEVGTAIFILALHRSDITNSQKQEIITYMKEIKYMLEEN